MTVKRYVADSARECLRRVKEELGPDAIVVSNRQVDGGVEITAMSADSLDALSMQNAPRVAAGGAVAGYASVQPRRALHRALLPVMAMTTPCPYPPAASVSSLISPGSDASTRACRQRGSTPPAPAAAA